MRMLRPVGKCSPQLFQVRRECNRLETLQFDNVALGQAIASWPAQSPGSALIAPAEAVPYMHPCNHSAIVRPFAGNLMEITLQGRPVADGCCKTLKSPLSLPRPHPNATVYD
jgi:hypothetical protein